MKIESLEFVSLSDVACLFVTLRKIYVVKYQIFVFKYLTFAVMSNLVYFKFYSGKKRIFFKALKYYFLFFLKLMYEISV